MCVCVGGGGGADFVATCNLHERAVLSVLISHAHRSLKFCGVHIYV